MEDKGGRLRISTPFSLLSPRVPQSLINFMGNVIYHVCQSILPLIVNLLYLIWCTAVINMWHFFQLWSLAAIMFCTLLQSEPFPVAINLLEA